MQYLYRFILNQNGAIKLMEGIFQDVKKIRNIIKEGPNSKMLMQKPFAEGMYIFTMFIISYYSRVREVLKLDYDSFIIIQTTITHKLHNLKKKYRSNSYQELENEWGKLVSKHKEVLKTVAADLENKEKKISKLSISSICLVTKLPKETVRRKVNKLVKKNLLKITKKEGITLGAMYSKIFQEFVPQTTLEISRLMKKWEKNGILKNLLDFKV